MTLTAADTKGEVIKNQITSVGIGLKPEDGPTQIYQKDTSTPITVVSAPANDLVVRPGNCTIGGACSAYDSTTQSGYFAIEVDTLSYKGYSKTKGVSKLVNYSATLDVSSFDNLQATWYYINEKGQQVDLTVNSNSQIALNNISGDINVYYNIGLANWGLEYGDDQLFDVHLIVPDTAFETPNFMNNGNGWEPGQNENKDFNTYNAVNPDGNDPTGARGGYIYANNDWSAASVTRKQSTIGGYFQKTLYRPYNSIKTLWEKENTSFEYGKKINATYNSENRQNQVTEGTQLISSLTVDSTKYAIDNQKYTILADTWNTNTQIVTGPAQISNLGSDTEYYIEWSTNIKGPEITNYNDQTGWVKQDNPIAGAQSFRIVFTTLTKTDKIVSVNIPMQVNDDLANSVVNIPDHAYFAIGENTQAPTGSDVIRYVTYKTTPTPSLDFTINPQEGISILPNKDDRQASWVVSPTINNEVSRDPVTAQIEIELDPCITNAVLDANPYYKASSIEIGGVCGSPDAKPGKMIIVPKNNGVWDMSTWVSGTSKLPQFTITTNASMLAKDQININGIFSINNSDNPLPATDSASLLVEDNILLANGIMALTPQVEVNQTLKYQAIISGESTSDEEYLKTIVALPNRGDDAGYKNNLNQAYNGPLSSNFINNYTFNYAIDVNNSTAGTKVLCALNLTTDPNSNEFSEENCQMNNDDIKLLSIVVPTQGDIITARVNINLTPNDNKIDDNYLMWMLSAVGPTTESAMPFPANEVVVASDISGHVYFDQYGKGIEYQAGEQGFNNVELGLFDANGKQIATTTTNNEGYYEFLNYNSGEYIVKIINNIPTKWQSQYNGELDLNQTYAYLNQINPNQPVSSTINLGIGSVISNVDFGFYAPDAHFDLDKQVSNVVCPSDIAQPCTVNWNVTIENNGNTDLTNGAFTDTTSQQVYNLETTIVDRVVKMVNRNVYDAVGYYAGGYVITAKGAVYSWGQGAVGGNGNGSTNKNLTPQKVIGLDDVSIIDIVSRVGQGAYALTADGEVYSWGNGTVGSNGNGSTATVYAAQKVQGLPNDIVKVVARSYKGGYAITNSGELYSWGVGANGANGNGSTNNNLTAQLVQGLDGVIVKDVVSRLSEGGYVLTDNGKVYSMGKGGIFGQNGNGSNNNDNLIAEPVQGLDGVNITEVITRGKTGALALSSAGEVYSWGAGFNGNDSDDRSNVAVKVQGIPNKVKQVVARSATGGMALTIDGKVYSWGRPASGANGNNSTDVNKKALEVLDLPSNIKKVVARDELGGYAITNSGEVYSWGIGANGANGNGSESNNETAMKVEGLDNVIVNDVIDRGASGAYALTNGGNVYSWGVGAEGSNGNGTINNNLTAQPVQGVSNVNSIFETASDKVYNGFALTNSGMVYSWGNGANGGIGNGSTNNNLTAQPVVPTWQEEKMALAKESEAIVSNGQDDFVQRQYKLPTINANGTLSINVSGLVNRTKLNQVIGNQAYASFTQTQPESAITLNELPDYGSPSNPYEAGKWTGNASCPTTGNISLLDKIFGRSTANASACDQVYAKIPGDPDANLGSISGIVFEDKNKNGTYQSGSDTLIPGVPVELRQGDGDVAGTTITNNDGSYTFDNLLPANNYYVVFYPNTKGIVYTTQTSSCPTENESCANNNGITPNITVVGEANTQNVNAGIISGIVPGIVVDKGFDNNEANYASQYTIESNGQITVNIKITNNGTEPLGDLSLSDKTNKGNKVSWQSCSLYNNSLNIEQSEDINQNSLIEFDKDLILNIGDSIICSGNLDTDADNLHFDDVTVNATGSLTQFADSNNSQFETIRGPGVAQPEEPTLNIICGEEKTVTLPVDSDKVTYTKVRQGDFVIVRANLVEPNDFFAEGVVSEWKFNIMAENCIVEPLKPELDKKVKCEEDYKIILPKIDGLEYILGEKIDGKVKVSVKTETGYDIKDGAVTEWILDVRNHEKCPIGPEVVNPTRPLPGTGSELLFISSILTLGSLLTITIRKKIN